jgi:mannosyltransferase OCH1-like enzyme
MMNMLATNALLLASSIALADRSIITPDFDTAMKSAKFNQVINDIRNYQELGITGIDMLTFFRTLYVKNNPAQIKRSRILKIPKIIHQIWIGKKLPAVFLKFVQSIQMYHPDWEYKLWTQDDIPQLNLRNQCFIDQSRNPGEISDLMRYEILYRYGGVYLDVDFQCLRSLEPLHYLYDFYIGIQPLDSQLVQLGIGIIGSIPGHPILDACIEKVKEGWANKHLEQKATARTGPIHCTKIFYTTADKNGLCDIALPCNYFYPLGCLQNASDEIEWVQQGAFAVHHWAKSWLYPSFRRPEFQSIENY